MKRLKTYKLFESLGDLELSDISKDDIEDILEILQDFLDDYGIIRRRTEDSNFFKTCNDLCPMDI